MKLLPKARCDGEEGEALLKIFASGALRDVTGLGKFLAFFPHNHHFNIAIRTFPSVKKILAEIEIEISLTLMATASLRSSRISCTRQTCSRRFSRIRFRANIFPSIISLLVCMLTSTSPLFICTFNSSQMRSDSRVVEGFSCSSSLSFSSLDGESVPLGSKKQISQSRNTSHAIPSSR